MKQIVRTIFLLSLAAMSLWAQANPGSMQGKVADDGGQAVGGVYVVATPLSPSATKTYTAITAASGEFRFDQAASGPYRLCAQGPGSVYLDSCLWTTSPTQVTVAAGQLTSNVTLRMNKGSIVRVRVNDPGQHLARGEGGLLLGISGPGFHFQPLHEVASDPSGKSFDVTIPFNTAIRLLINSRQLELADENQLPLGTGQSSIAIQQAPGQAERALTLHITGKK